MPPEYVILGRENCPYCTMAKEFLDQLGKTYVYFDVRKDLVLRDFLIANRLTTVPQVYKNGNLIGGYDSLKASLQDG